MKNNTEFNLRPKQVAVLVNMACQIIGQLHIRKKALQEAAKQESLKKIGIPHESLVQAS